MGRQHLSMENQPNDCGSLRKGPHTFGGSPRRPILARGTSPNSGEFVVGCQQGTFMELPGPSRVRFSGPHIRRIAKNLPGRFTPKSNDLYGILSRGFRSDALRWVLRAGDPRRASTRYFSSGCLGEKFCSPSLVDGKWGNRSPDFDRRRCPQKIWIECAGGERRTSSTNACRPRSPQRSNSL